MIEIKEKITTLPSIPCYQIEPEENQEEKINKIMNGGFTLQETLGEKPIWYFEWLGGIFSKSVEEIWVVSNYRVMKMNFFENRLIQVPLKYVDVAVTEQHSVTESRGMAYGAGLPGSIAIGAAVIQRTSNSRRFGTLNFVFNGGTHLEFFNVFDPVGVRQLIKIVKKQMYGK